MTPLPLTLQKNGYEYTQIQRGIRSCIYKMRDLTPIPKKYEHIPRIDYYEVFLIKIKPERTIKGKIIPAKEWFPGNEAGGTWLWTFRVYEEALFIFKQLEAGKKKEEFLDYKTGKKIYG